MTMLKLAVAALAIAGGCRGGRPLQQGGDMSATELRWVRREIAAIGLSVELLDDAEVKSDAGPDGAYLWQRRPPFELAIWWGNKATLADWQRWIFEGASTATLGTTAAIKLCGADAVEQHAELPGGDVAGLVQRGGRLEPHRSRHPAMRHTVVALRRRGVPVLLSFAVELDQREALHDVERRFFAAVKCP